MEFVFVAEVGPALATDGVDGMLVEAASAFGDAVGETAAESDGAGSTLFEASVIEESIRVGVDEFVSELGWDRGVDCEAADGARLDLLEDLDEALEVHGLLQNIFHHFVDERVIRDLDVADDGFEAGGSLGEDTGEEVFGAGALDLRGDALPFRHAEELEATTSGPAPASFEYGAGDGGLLEEFPGGVFGEELEDFAKGE